MQSQLDVAEGTCSHADMPKRKVKKQSATGRVNKSAWIRSQPTSTPAKDVVEKAKKEGIHISLAQVYTARSTAKNTAGKVRSPQIAVTGARRPGRPAGGGSKGESELAFRRLVLSIGVDKAELYMSELKRGIGL
jgi:hypothetical protein